MSLSEFRRYRTIYSTGIKTALGIDMAYLANFYSAILQMLLRLVGAYIFIEVLYSNINEINGWQKYDLWLLYGIFGLSQEIFFSLFYDTQKIGGKIKDGDLDSYLLKPIPTLYSLVIINPFLFSLPDIFTSALIIFYAFINGSSMNLPLVLFIVIISIFFYYSVNLLFQTLNFYTLFPHTAGNLANNIIDFGKTPASFFNQGIQIFLSFVFPLFLISGVAFGIQKGSYPTSILIPVTVVVICLYTLSLKFWKLGLSKYSSASS